MTINPALNFLPNAVGQSRPQIIPAVVANNTTRTPLPTSYNDPLYVVNPSSEDNFWVVSDWTVDHGGNLPAAGAACALFYDSNGVLRCVWWDGLYISPPMNFVSASGKTTASDLDWVVTPRDGALEVTYDTSAGKTYLHARANGAWHVMSGPV